MPAFSLPSRPPRGAGGRPAPIVDADRLAAHLEDAAHFTGGHARALFAPSNESEVAEVLRTERPVLVVGAQSSLTGGATPMGEAVLSTARLNRIVQVGSNAMRVQPGVTLAAVDAALAPLGRYYPPGPTFTGAFIGGTVATNAAGAATFKYGTTRDWVQALTVVLPDGDVLDIERGAVSAHPDGYFELKLARGNLRVPVPHYAMPAVPKLSAGYFARPGMDLIDLFIGSEGTLGVITEVTLRILPERPAFCFAFVPVRERRAGLALVRALRDAARETWRTGDPNGIDVSAIEHMDHRCLELLREDGVDTRTGVHLPGPAQLALLITLELRASTTAGAALDALAAGGDAGDSAPARFARLLVEHGVEGDAQIALPGDARRAAQLLALREAVPAGVNQRIGRAKRTVDAAIEKTAGDVVVPVDRVDAFLEFIDAELERRGLDGAVWGHISDGNFHPNVMPRSRDELESGRAALLAIGREAIRASGAPLAEHGVGRSRVKQQLLEEMYGASGVDEMRQVKQAIDPAWALAPGVLFSNW